MIDLNPTIPIITLNVNGLNIPIKKHKTSGWIEKVRCNYRLSLRNPLKYKDTNKLKVK